MTEPISHVVIVGGGTAGWLTACLLAANQQPALGGASVRITLVDSATIGPIGVGEGTWPTMRETLRKIGISELQLIQRTGATFKQASKFINWHTTHTQNSYYHPFSAPQGSASVDITPYWLTGHADVPYAEAVSFQPAICGAGLAPKTDSQNSRGPVINYGYHLDANQFIALLQEHGTNQLGIEHIRDDVTQVATSDAGIDSVTTTHHGELRGDLFVDCSGFNSLLLEKALGATRTDCSDTLFADSALVCQQPYASATQPVACYTASTAQAAGWIWDIGLQARKGVGHVYSSQFTDDETAQQCLQAYLGVSAEAMPATRKINFTTGFTETPWVKNCVAIGLSSGFLEPLEASALMLIEQGATLLAEQLPAVTALLPGVARRYNEAMSEQWHSAIMFLKLHYLLSDRHEPFWQQNRDPSSVPDKLRDLMTEWHYRPPLDSDFTNRNEVFSAQSYRYILYGMMARTEPAHLRSFVAEDNANQQFLLNKMLTDKLLTALPSHRSLLDSLVS